MLGIRRRNQYLFTPKKISGIVAWYDASNLASITKDGGNLVSQWSDISGNAKHLTQATGSAQPLFVSAALNNRAVIRTDGVNDSLVSPAMGFSGDQALTILAVFKQISGGYNIGFSVTTAGGLYDNKWNHLLGTAVNTTGVSTSFHLRTITKSAGVFNPNAVQRINAESATNTYSGTQAATYIPNFNVSTTFNIGSFWGSFGSLDVAEIVIYNRVLNATELAKVENYLKRKYAL
jgi:hypothetical protein